MKIGPGICHAGSVRHFDRSVMPGPVYRFSTSRSGRDLRHRDDYMGRRGLYRAEMGTFVHFRGSMHGAASLWPDHHEGSERCSGWPRESDHLDLNRTGHSNNA